MLFYCLSLVFGATAVVFAMFVYYGNDLPNESVLLQYSPLTTSKINSREKVLMEEYSIERRVLLSFEQMSQNIIWAFLIAEDKDFFKHAGIKSSSLLRAIIKNTKKNSWGTRPSGGSTITQQLAKN